MTLTAPTSPLESITVDDGTVIVRCSTVGDGDFHLDRDPDELDVTRQKFQPGSWSQPAEVHGVEASWVDVPGGGDRAPADIVLTRLPREILGVWVGDCAPLALITSDGLLAGVHAGWRGALAGVVGNALTSMGSSSDAPVVAVLGPCIHPCCYEFSAHELSRFVDRFGVGVVGRTSWGTAALDMPAVVRSALAERGVDLVDRSVCTGCSPAAYFSHRRRAQRGRHVLTIEKVPSS